MYREAVILPVFQGNSALSKKAVRYDTVVVSRENVLKAVQDFFVRLAFQKRQRKAR